MERNFLREYKKFNFYTFGPLDEPTADGDFRLEINNPNDEAVQGIYYKSTDPTAINKAVEKAKNWVNRELKKKGDDVTAVQYGDDDLRDFKVIIENKLEAVEKELEYLQNFIKNEEADTLEKPQMEQMAIRQQTYIQKLKDALTRIADKSYGICRVSGKLIDKDRLRAVPHATLSIDAKKNDLDDVPPAKFNAGERKCRVCGCTEDDCSQCVEKTGKQCRWVEWDLCSACVPVQEKSETISSPINTDDMNFFKQMAAIGNIDITMRIMQKGDQLTMNIMPGSPKSTNKPYNVTGTGAELDEGFFQEVFPTVVQIQGLRSNKDEAVKSAEDQKEKSVKKATPKKKTAVKKEVKKPAPKPAAKPKAEKKVAPKKEEQPKVKEASFLEEPAAETTEA